MKDTRVPAVYFVGAGPGDPDLITVKGRDLMQKADVLIYAGSLVNPSLVAQSAAAVKIDSWGLSLEKICAEIENAFNAGKLVVRLHSGDPSVFGAIIEQITLLQNHEIPVEIVPGVSSLFAAASALQIELILNGITDAVVITRPSGKTLQQDHIPEFSRLGATIAVFLGADRFDDVIQKFRCAPETPAAVVYHASWPDQKIVRGTVSDIAGKARDAGITKTALLIVGDSVDPGLRYRRSHLYS